MYLPALVCVKNTFERRIGIWPAGFDKEDMMYCNTAFGDYPHRIPGPGYCANRLWQRWQVALGFTGLDVAEL